MRQLLFLSYIKIFLSPRDFSLNNLLNPGTVFSWTVFGVLLGNCRKFIIWNLQTKTEDKGKTVNPDLTWLGLYWPKPQRQVFFIHKKKLPSVSSSSFQIIKHLPLGWSYLSLIVPSKTFKGPITPAGYVPVYSANGTQYYLVSLTAYLLLIWRVPTLPTDIWRHFDDIISSSNIFSLFFCLYILIKGTDKNDKNINHNL